MMNERLLRIFYDGQQLLAEGTVSGSTVTLKARYKVGSRVAVREDGSGTKSYYLQNGHKDVVGLANASGQLVNTYTYDLWGNPQTTLEGVDNPFRYSGEFWDKDTGLQYLRARWYDPSMGRFMNEDTYEGDIANPLSQNLYSYVHNNPLKWVDPTGHWCQATVNGVNYSHPGGCNDDGDGERTSGPGYTIDEVHNGDWYKNNEGEWQQYFLPGSPQFNDPTGGFLYDVVGCAYDSQCVGFVSVGVAEAPVVYNGAKSGFSKGWNWVKGLVGTKAVPEYVNMLDKAVKTDDLIVGAMESGKITKVFLQKADLNGLGHKAFMEGSEVGFYVYKDVLTGQIMARGSGTASATGSRPDRRI